MNPNAGVQSSSLSTLELTGKPYAFQALDGARMLSLGSTVDAMILHVTDNQVMRNGWPVEWCDVLLVGKGLLEHRNPSYSPLEWLSFAETFCPQLIILEDGDKEVPCWAGNEERTVTVMKVDDGLGKKKSPALQGSM